jgi:hypothetical protein
VDVLPQLQSLQLHLCHHRHPAAAAATTTTSWLRTAASRAASAAAAVTAATATTTTTAVVAASGFVSLYDPLFHLLATTAATNLRSITSWSGARHATRDAEYTARKQRSIRDDGHMCVAMNALMCHPSSAAIVVVVVKVGRVVVSVPRDGDHYAII